MKDIKLLVVEDNEFLIILLKEVLKTTSHNFTTNFINDGAEVAPYLNTLEENNLPDLILLDIHLPNKNGLEILESIKKDNLYQKIQVVLFSSTFDMRNIPTSQFQLADETLQKPHTYVELNEILEQLMKLYHNNPLTTTI